MRRHEPGKPSLEAMVARGARGSGFGDLGLAVAGGMSFGLAIRSAQTRFGRADCLTASRESRLQKSTTQEI